MAMEKVHYEYRTKKALVAIFATPQQAHEWAKKKDQSYIAALKLVKVTTTVTVEAA